MLHAEDSVSVELSDAPREHENRLLAFSLQALNHEALVGEDRIIGVVDVVPAEELVIEEAGGSGRGDHHTGRDDLHVTSGAGELRGALLLCERLSGLRRHLVDHRVPDRTAELQEADVDGSLHEEAVRVGGAAVIEVQEALYAVIDEERGITNRAVCRGCEGLHDDAEAAVAYRDTRLCLDKRVKSELLEGLFKLWEWVGGEDDHRVLVAVSLQPFGVKVVPMQVADVEVIGSPQGGMVEFVVSWVWEPACVIRRIKPGVAQD